MIQLYNTRQDFLSQNNDYRRFLRKSVEIFREGMNQKAQQYNIKIPEDVALTMNKSDLNRNMKRDIIKKYAKLGTKQK